MNSIWTKRKALFLILNLILEYATGNQIASVKIGNTTLTGETVGDTNGKRYHTFKNIQYGDLILGSSDYREAIQVPPTPNDPNQSNNGINCGAQGNCLFLNIHTPFIPTNTTNHTRDSTKHTVKVPRSYNPESQNMTLKSRKEIVQPDGSILIEEEFEEERKWEETYTKAVLIRKPRTKKPIFPNNTETVSQFDDQQHNETFTQNQTLHTNTINYTHENTNLKNDSNKPLQGNQTDDFEDMDISEIINKYFSNEKFQTKQNNTIIKTSKHKMKGNKLGIPQHHNRPLIRPHFKNDGPGPHAHAGRRPGPTWRPGSVHDTEVEGDDYEFETQNGTTTHTGINRTRVIRVRRPNTHPSNITADWEFGNHTHFGPGQGSNGHGKKRPGRPGRPGNLFDTEGEGDDYEFETQNGTTTHTGVNRTRVIRVRRPNTHPSNGTADWEFGNHTLFGTGHGPHEHGGRRPGRPGRPGNVHDTEGEGDDFEFETQNGTITHTGVNRTRVIRLRRPNTHLSNGTADWEFGNYTHFRPGHGPHGHGGRRPDRPGRPGNVYDIESEGDDYEFETQNGTTTHTGVNRTRVIRLRRPNTHPSNGTADWEFGNNTHFRPGHGPHGHSGRRPGRPGRPGNVYDTEGERDDYEFETQNGTTTHTGVNRTRVIRLRRPNTHPSNGTADWEFGNYTHFRPGHGPHGHGGRRPGRPGRPGNVYDTEGEGDDYEFETQNGRTTHTGVNRTRVIRLRRPNTHPSNGTADWEFGNHTHFGPGHGPHGHGGRRPGRPGRPGNVYDIEGEGDDYDFETQNGTTTHTGVNRTRVIKLRRPNTHPSNGTADWEFGNYTHFRPGHGPHGHGGRRPGRPGRPGNVYDTEGEGDDYEFETQNGTTTHIGVNRTRVIRLRRPNTHPSNGTADWEFGNHTHFGPGHGPHGHGGRRPGRPGRPGNVYDTEGEGDDFEFELQNGTTTHTGVNRTRVKRVRRPNTHPSNGTADGHSENHTPGRPRSPDVGHDGELELKNITSSFGGGNKTRVPSSRPQFHPKPSPLNNVTINRIVSFMLDELKVPPQCRCNESFNLLKTEVKRFSFMLPLFYKAYLRSQYLNNIEHLLTSPKDCKCVRKVVNNRQHVKKVNPLKSVMVYLQGFENNSINFDPLPLVKNDVVVVTMQYRDIVNVGFNDQILALKWIKENIESFGGNPNDVTIFGDGANVAMHLSSTKSKGLYKKAIMMDPTNEAWSNTSSTPGNVPLLIGFTNSEGLYWSKSKQDTILPETDADFVELLTNLGVFQENNVSDPISVARMVRNVYFPNITVNRDNDYNSYVQLIGDLKSIMPALRTIRMRSKSHSRSPIYLYKFEVDAHNNYYKLKKGLASTDYSGATRFDILGYLFSYSDHPVIVPGSLEDRTQKMIRIYWTNFAKTGSPNQPYSNYPLWCAYNRNAGFSGLKFSRYPADGRMDEENEVFNFWETVLNQNV